MLKITAYISRIFVGSLFIVSGLIKANDTIGFSYKLEEYFENGALAYRVRDIFGWDTFSLTSFSEHALLFAILMCAAEIILGFSILFGAKIKFTLFSLFALTIMFFFLTLHTATCNSDATYTELTTVQDSSPKYNSFINKMETDSTIKIREKDGEKVTFEQQLPVQCVKDCGCFGDAMKGSLGRSMSPWESFGKDVILLLFLIPIFFYRKKIKLNTAKDDIIILGIAILCILFYAWVFNWYFPILFAAIGFTIYYLSKKLIKDKITAWLPLVIVAIISLIFIYYTTSHLPIKDYRAYAVGKSIPEQMVLPAGAVPDVYENIFYYKNKTTGKVEEFTEKNYPWKDDNYEFVDRTSKLIQIGDKAEAADFSIKAADGNDYTQDFFEEENSVFMLIAYDISKTNEETFKKINTFADKCNTSGQYFIGLTASNLATKVEDFKHKNKITFDFYNCDDVVLKTIIRANPGIILLKKGKIIAKWNANNLPEYKLVDDKYLK